MVATECKVYPPIVAICIWSGWVLGGPESPDLVWIVPGYLMQNRGSIGQVLFYIALVKIIMTYPIKLFWGTVVIMNS